MRFVMRKIVAKVDDPYRESGVHYLVVNLDTMQPDIVEVQPGTPGSFATLQAAKDHAMTELKKRIGEGLESVNRIRNIGIDIQRLM